ncbi:hypothetical protein BWZ22_11015 [Seonamhaeicola sp. S2-3]|uniref:T9SS type A sorting domain-containing protein n=1 Tax=Seonamhaeicola sp. S2-3 TaxID=1936081 RepID=UPI00097268C5|nr:T9SS type A sorting domain-containing protein [Seonamhaeicola sp. S2-3]APY11734.1 hypothetical protein BWZ22_11015 [Seonamhaeicola sp. S2-3]
MKLTLQILSVLLTLFNVFSSHSQSTETFEDEVVESNTFTDNGLTFNISSNNNDETYDIYNCSDCGWNGSTVDDQFIDNTGGLNGPGNGTNLIVKTNDGTDIKVSSFYVFCSNVSLQNFSSGYLTIEGKKDNNTVFTITKNSGFSNVDIFSPNNGFTFIDLSTEGGVDYSNTPIDELVFTGTQQLDYISLDAFVWDYATPPLSSDNITNLNNSFKVYQDANHDILNIKTEIKEYSYVLYNIQGQVLLKNKNNTSNTINVSKLSPGTYILKILSENKSHTVKIAIK